MLAGEEGIGFGGLFQGFQNNFANFGLFIDDNRKKAIAYGMIRGRLFVQQDLLLHIWGTLPPEVAFEFLSMCDFTFQLKIKSFAVQKIHIAFLNEIVTKKAI